jgi:predicted GIY-YIG superfamily endonuclease
MIKTRKQKIYTGITVDLEHLSGIGGTKFFRSDTPEEIVYVEGMYAHGDALRREIEIKKLKANLKRDLIHK